MAIYKLNGREVTEEEFNKQVFKAVEKSPFFLDEVITGFSSFSGDDRDLLSKLRDDGISAEKSKSKEKFKKITVNLHKPNTSQKEKIDQIKNYIFNSNKCNTFNEVLNVLHAESEEELEDILKRNMNIGASEYSNPKLEKKFSDLVDKINLGEVGWVKNNTGGTVFEKVQDTTTNEGQINLLGELSEKIKAKQQNELGKGINEDPMANNIWQRPHTEDHHNITSDITKSAGKKETENKTDYSEIDWQFITQLAERMNKNKDKYETNNWKRSIDVELLKQSLLRHVIAVLNGDYEDDGRPQGHLEAIALNAQMINYQLKNK